MPKTLFPLLLCFLFPLSAFGLEVSSDEVQRELNSAVLVADIRIEKIQHSPDPRYYAVFEATATLLHRLKIADDGEWIPAEGDSFVFRGIGGELAGKGVYFSGMPRPHLQEEYTAYLTRAGGNEFQITGFEYGLTPHHLTRSFSRNRTDGSNGNGTGAFLYWDESYFPIPYFISAPSFQGLGDFVGAIDASFQTWRNIADTKIEFLPMGCSSSTRNENDGLNTIILIRQNWPFDPAAIAITRNFYLADSSPRPGMILDTDILLNGVDHDFSTTGDPDKYDVQDIVTHEAGHFLGMGHEVNPVDTDATMYAVADPGETNKRTLHPDDLLGIHAAYQGVGNKLGVLRTTCEIAASQPSCAAVHRENSSPWPMAWIVVYLLTMIGLGRAIVHRSHRP